MTKTNGPSDYNTAASYLLRAMIAVQMINFGLELAFRDAFNKNLLDLQRVVWISALLVPVLLLVEFFTPVAHLRGSARNFDIKLSLAWLTAIGVTLLYGLKHCSDC